MTTISGTAQVSKPRFSTPQLAVGGATIALVGGGIGAFVGSKIGAGHALSGALAGAVALLAGGGLLAFNTGSSGVGAAVLEVGITSACIAHSSNRDPVGTALGAHDDCID